MRQSSLSKLLSSKDNHTSTSFDVVKDPKRLDGLLPNQRSAAERRQSFLQRSTSSASPTSGSSRSSSSSMAFDFCASESSTSSDDDDDELALVLQQRDANKTTLSPEATRNESTILKIKTQEASLELVTTTSTMNLSLKRVRFGNVTVHYHPTILGDNPSVSSGAPLALGWKRVGDAEIYTVDAAQAAASSRPTESSSLSSSQQQKQQLKLGPCARQRRLQQAGVPYIDILRRTETCDMARMAQLESIQRAKQTAQTKKVVPRRRCKFWPRFFVFARAPS